MNFQDKTIICKDCGREFIWTKEEQEFYQQKGFNNQPGRCKDCRVLKKARFNKERFPENTRKQSFEIICSNCGKKDLVPFKPRNPNSVLCKNCYRNK